MSSSRRRRCRSAPVALIGVLIASTLVLATPASAQEPEIDAPDPDAFIPAGPPRANPQIPAVDARCGLDIAVVIDLSNSIDDTELEQLKTAGREFVTALEGTASAVGIYNFATFAPANASAANAPLSLQEVGSTAGATAARSKITGLTRPTSANGGTNWDRGLAQVTASGQHYDGVLFLTDGDPTAFGIPPNQPPGNNDFGTGVDQIDVTSAVASANTIKDALTRIVAVGIGTGSSPGSVQRLQAISGPTENVDYFLGDFDTLAALLTELASGICDGTITVNKLVRSASTGTTSPGAGWTFTSSGVGVTPATATTQAAGSVLFTTEFTDSTDLPRPVTLTETLLPGFALEPQANGATATCIDGDSQPVAVTNAGATGFTIQVAPLDNLTCTVINRQLAPPLLTLVKEVTNDDGGTAGTGAWTLSATGPTTISGVSGAPAVTAATVAPGTYTLAESAGPAGYEPSDWVCDGGVQQGASLTLAFDDDVTCTITNDDIGPTLTLVKELVQDPASPTLPTAWTLNATGPTPISGSTGAPAVTSAPVDAGGYTLSETGPDGYELAGWTCTGATNAGATVTIPLAAAVTCTATNAAVPAWTLAKSSTPASGATVLPGGEVAYTLTVENTSDATVTGITVTDDLADVLDDAGLDPADIVASAGTAELVGTDLTWTVPTLAAGASATLTYTVTVDAGAFGVALRNVATGTGDVPPDTCPPGSTDCTTDYPTPLAPRLTLVKEVTNDDGGTAAATAWTLTADGPSTITGSTGGTEVTNVAVDAGTYSLSEDGPAGYAPSGWVCVGGTQTDDEIALALGDTATCAITNDDIGPTLTLVKELDQPAGSPVEPTAWDLTATGPTTITGATGGPEVTDAPVAAGDYALTESGGVDGYELVGWDCTGASLAGTTVTVPLAADVTCTATNRPLPVDLHIEKLHRVTGTTDDRDVVVGDSETFDYDIVVRNAGQGPATNVVVTDDIPTTLAVDEATITAPTGWTVELAGQDADGFGGTLTATFPGPFAPGDEATISYSVTVGALPQLDPTQPPAPIVNTATVTSDGDDETPGDNTSTEETPVKAVTLTAAGVCRDELPFLDYAIGPVGFTPTSVTLNWWNPDVWNDGNPTGPPSATSTIPLDQLTGTLLWHGAAVDAAGNQIDWPGWTLRPDGTWFEDPSSTGADLRPSTVIEVVANPTVAALEAYPPITPICNPNPPAPTPSPDPSGQRPSNSGSAGSGGNLPRTGADPVWLALIGAGLLVAGSGFVRLRPRRGWHLAT